MNIKQIKINEVKPYNRNPRFNDSAVAAVASSIKQFGFRQPIVVDANGVIIIGHTRLKAAQSLGLKTVPVHAAENLSEAEAKALRLADNKTGELAWWDEEMLPAELSDLIGTGIDMDDFGFSADEVDHIIGGDEEDEEALKLAERFLAVPFSCLDARQGYWQDRKEQWKSLGIESELGRFDKDQKRAYGESSQPIHVYKNKEAYQKKLGHEVSWKDFYEAHPDEYRQEGISIFDPVLAEIAVRWFCPPGGTILDPFAGGSVRGLVASRLGRKYIGVELRGEQIEANRRQADQICRAGDPPPEWIEGDSLDIKELCKGTKADFVFTCPPYADLEVYSDDPRDLSAMPAAEFEKVYHKILKDSCSFLKPDRFAFIVICDVRGGEGFFRSLPNLTTQAFSAGGCELYNDAILLTPIGSLAIRAGGNFVKTRKLAKTHQNVLIYCNGDARQATEQVGEIEVIMPVDEATG